MKFQVFICHLLVIAAVTIALGGCATPQYYILPDESPAVGATILEPAPAIETAPTPTPVSAIETTTSGTPLHGYAPVPAYVAPAPAEEKAAPAPAKKTAPAKKKKK